jgi:hypothetical protein
VPAAKLARREGVEFLLDPLWQQVSDEFVERAQSVRGDLDDSGRLRDSVSKER